MVFVFGCTVIAVGFGGVTITLQVADIPLPSLAVQVMIATPTPMAVISPVSFTFATSGLFDVQLTVLSVASAGETVIQ